MEKRDPYKDSTDTNKVTPNYFENLFCKLEIKEGIMFGMLAPFLHIDLTVAQTIIADRIKFSSEKNYPLVLDISNLKFIDREAREYWASEEGSLNLCAAAYIVSTQQEKLLWSLLLSINRPEIPSKIFSSKNAAIEWLLDYI